MDVLTAKSIIRDAGLHGRTIAPKKKPKRKALVFGFLFEFATLICGKILLKFTLKIRRKLTMKRIPNAIGETISVTLVRDTLKIAVKMRPIRKREVITPRVTIQPSVEILISSSLD